MKTNNMNTGTTTGILLTTPAISKPLSKMELIKVRGEAIRNGEMTAFEVGRELKLTERQIMFAQYYATSEEFFFQGAKAYAKAYGYDYNDRNQRNTINVGSNTCLKHSTILTFIQMLLDGEGLNDSFVDKQILSVITQSADLKAKMLAIREYNSITGRNKRLLEVTVNNTYNYAALSPEELATMIQLHDKTRLGNG